MKDPGRVKFFSVYNVQQGRDERHLDPPCHSNCKRVDSHTLFRVQVNCLRVLNNPPCPLQHAVDLFTGYVFGAKGHREVKIVQEGANCKRDLGCCGLPYR